MSDLYEKLKIAYPDMYSYCGFSVGEGWNSIIEDLSEKLSKLGGFEVVQVKEKFGTLRFYTHNDGNGNEQNVIEGRRLIREAEIKSSKTCESCGEPGTMQNDLSWVKTLCKTHYEQRLDHIAKEKAFYKAEAEKRAQTARQAD